MTFRMAVVVFSMERSCDYFTWTGANYLADQISAYWAAKPYKGLEVRVLQGEKIPGDRSAVFVVRSNMINGLPPLKGPDRTDIDAAYGPAVGEKLARIQQRFNR
jgi:hypothetical protein